MDFNDPAQRAAFFDVHQGLDREGPGDRESLLRALSLVGPLPKAPRVLDLGCGPGGQTLDLAAQLPGAKVLAIDLHAPFLSRLDARAEAAGVGDRVRTLRADMAKLDLETGSFDLVWCEGAAYAIGFGNALDLWRPLLAPGGRLAVTEAVWLKENPPKAARDTFADYSGMGDAATARAAAVAAGYRILGDFVLPEAAWWTHYYGPMEARLERIAPRLEQTEAGRIVLAEHRAEIECYRNHSDAYGYLFLVLA